MRMEDEFACVGYFGFGIGVAMHRRTGLARQYEASYCSNTCTRNSDCWTKHRERVATILPGLAALQEELVKTGLRGPALVREMQRQIAQESGRPAADVAPPELYVMAGNIEDGARIAAGLLPKDRGQGTLRYPFES